MESKTLYVLFSCIEDNEKVSARMAQYAILDAIIGGKFKDNGFVLTLENVGEFNREKKVWKKY